MDEGLVERSAAGDVGGEALLSVVLLAGLLPVCRGEREEPGLVPAGEQAEKIAEIRPGLEVVELAAREQGHEDGIDLGGIVVAHEQPIATSDHLAAEGELAA